MSTPVLLLPLLLFGLWACGDDEDGLTAPVLRPSGELLPWDLSAIVSIDDVRSMPQGMPLYMRTEFANGELADPEMRFVQGGGRLPAAHAGDHGGGLCGVRPMGPIGRLVA